MMHRPFSAKITLLLLTSLLFSTVVQAQKTCSAAGTYYCDNGSFGSIPLNPPTSEVCSTSEVGALAVVPSMQIPGYSEGPWGLQSCVGPLGESSERCIFKRTYTFDEFNQFDQFAQINTVPCESCPPGTEYEIIGSNSRCISKFVASADETKNSCNTEGNPCDVTTGRKTQTENDLQLQHISLMRYYDSGSTYPGIRIGANWRHSFDTAINQQLGADPAGGAALPSAVVTPNSSTRSAEYNSAKDACERGWDDISSTAYNGLINNSYGRYNTTTEECEVVSLAGNQVVGSATIRNTAAFTAAGNPPKLQTISRPDGAFYSFIETTPGSEAYTETRGYNVRLKKDGNDWLFYDNDNSIDRFRNGRMIERTLPNKQILQLSYNSDGSIASVSDAYGQTLSFSYNSDGQISSLSHSDGQLQYQYDSNYNLSKVIYEDSSEKTYHYEDTNFVHHLTGITNENNVRYATWTYDIQGRATSSVHANNADNTTFTYNNNTTVVTDAKGGTRTYNIGVVNKKLAVTSVTGTPCHNCYRGDSTNRSYDSNGELISTTDWNGNITHYTRDEQGNELSRTEAVGTPEERTISTTWHPEFEKPTQIIEPGLSTEMTYDTAGNLLNQTLIDTQTPACITDNTLAQCRQISTYTWSTDNQMLSMDGPRTDVNDVTTYTYDAQGNRTSIINALNHTITLQNFNARGQAQTIIDANGIETQLSYTPRGWLQSVTIKHPSNNTLDATTNYHYDGIGQLIKTTQANGVELNYHYDAAQRLIAISNNNGERIDYSLNDAGDITQETISDSNSTIQYQINRAYDDRSRIIQTIAGEGQTTAMNYDENNNNTSTTNPRVLTTQNSYDPLDRLTQSSDPDGATTNFTYDNLDRTTSVTDANGNTTLYTYDGFGNIIEQESPDTGITTYSYDAANNRTSMVDNKGIITTYQYDALNRLSNVSYPDTTANITYSYDQGANGIGRVTSYSDKSGTTNYSYNYLGQQIAVSTTIGSRSYNTSQQFDLNGLALQQQYPSGATVNYQRDNLGRINQITVNNTPAGLNQIIADNIQYQAYGDISSFTYGNELLHNRSYDQSYRLTDLTVTGTSNNIEDSDYNYDANDNILQITDFVTSIDTQQFTYDNLDRLISEASSYGSKTYNYDAVGNRLQRIFNKPDATVGTQTLSYATNSNRMTFWGAKPVSYDNNGNITNVTDPEGNDKHTWAYDDRNRMTDYWKQGVLKAKYNYNAMGQRVSKVKYKLTPEQLEEEGNTFHYHYNQSGQLQQETIYKPNTTLPKRQRHYIWLNDMPVAYLETIYKNDGSLKSETLHYLIADHLNTPRKATNQAQTITWLWHGDAFGKGGINNDADGDTVKTTINLRFPGQYKDGESGLHYNYFRDYDPRTGRYVQSDPIGLAGGINTYIYALNNPIVFVDPTGQAAVIPLIPVIPGIVKSIGAALTGIGIGFSLNQAINQANSPEQSQSDEADQCPDDDNVCENLLADIERLAVLINNLSELGEFANTNVTLEEAIKKFNELMEEYNLLCN